MQFQPQPHPAPNYVNYAPPLPPQSPVSVYTVYPPVQQHLIAPVFPQQQVITEVPQPPPAYVKNSYKKTDYYGEARADTPPPREIIIEPSENPSKKSVFW